MKKVFQTKFDNHDANCLQSAVASLLNLNIDDVPNFIEHGEKWGEVWDEFWHKRGIDPLVLEREVYGTEKLKEVALFDGGVDGYFIATVNSQTFKGDLHAVLVDRNLNVVHDPNPNQKAITLKAVDVIEIIIMNNIVIGENGQLSTTKSND